MTEFPSAFPPIQQPPLQPQYAPPEKKPAWPIAIGIISIVLGSLILICVPINMATGAHNPQAAKLQEQFPEWFQTYSIISSLISMGLGVLLLVGGILLIRRRAVARPLHLAYAVGTVLMGVVGLVVSFSVILPSLDPADLPPGMSVGIMKIIVVGTTFLNVAPVFLLIWFLRGSIRDQVQSWAAGAGLGAQQQTWDIPTAPPPAL